DEGRAARNDRAFAQFSHEASVSTSSRSARDREPVPAPGSRSGTPQVACTDPAGGGSLRACCEALAIVATPAETADSAGWPHGRPATDSRTTRSGAHEPAHRRRRRGPDRAGTGRTRG